MHGINVVGRWKLISAKAENPDGDVWYLSLHLEQSGL